MPQDMKTKVTWEIPEFRKPKRGRNWYVIAGTIAFLMIFFSFFSINLSPLKILFLGNNNNFLFALIIILGAGIMMLIESREPQMIKVLLDGDGVKLGEKFYDYDDIKNFSIVYRPKDSIKNLYFEFKNSARFRLSLPLRSLDHMAVRAFLKRYLEEDLERTHPPLSEQLTKVLKL
ncbi:hypothetical protein JXK06_03620 [Patescibacteria group bacterium]|nr:hypothetical protein [Patescibacteria group bacterium]